MVKFMKEDIHMIFSGSLFYELRENQYNTVPPHVGYRPATSWVHYTTSCNTQSNAPEDGRNHCPKHVELIGIINNPLLLHLVGCLYCCINVARSNNEEISLQLSYMKSEHNINHPIFYEITNRCRYMQSILFHY